MSVLIETSAGDIVVDLYVSRCPVAAKNFLKLCKTHYYDGVLVFNVERDFIAQTGDPTGTGNGGMSMNGLLGGAHHFKHEISSEIKHDSIGLLGMTARNNTNEPNGSQFYITLRKDIDYLDGKFTIFGKVEEDPSSTIKAINSLWVFRLDLLSYPSVVFPRTHTHTHRHRQRWTIDLVSRRNGLRTITLAFCCQ